MADGKVVIDTELDGSGAESGMQKLGGTLGKIGGGVLAGTAAAVTGVSAAIGGLGVSAVKYNASMEQYQTSFEVMTGSATKAEEVMTKLKEVGAKTPFEFEDLAQAEQLLMNYGFTADDAMDKMMMLGDISQGSAEKMQRVAAAYGQMSSAGKVQLEDVKQMIEAGFNPLQEISQSTGESMDSLYDRISKGTISVDEITASMERSTSAGGKYFESMDKQSQTVAGQFSTLKDNFQQMAGEIFSGLSASIGTSALPIVNGWISELQKGFSENGTAGLITALGSVLGEAVAEGAELAPQLIDMAVLLLATLGQAIIDNGPIIMESFSKIFDSILNGISTLIPGLTPLTDAIMFLKSNLDIVLAAVVPLVAAFVAWKAVMEISALITAVSTALNGMTIAQYALNLAMSLNPIGIVVALIAGLIAAIVYLWNTNEDFRNAVIEIFGAIEDFISAAVDAIVSSFTVKIPALVSNVLRWFQQIPDGIKKIFSTAADIGKGLVDGIWQGISDGWDWLIEKVQDLARDLLKATKSVLGIHSPSTEFAYIGEMSAEGMMVGFDDADPVGAIKSSIAGSLGNIQTNVSAMDSGKNSIVSSALSSIANGASYAGDLVFKIGETEVARTLLNPLLSEMSRQGYDVEVIGG